MSDQNPREIAARVLRQRTQGEYIETALDRFLLQARLSSPDRALCQELVYGIVRWQATLDWLISRKTGRPQTPRILDFLRIGLYQIFWLDRIPGHAAVNETVELAKRNGFGPQSGFINAVLRGYLREFEGTKELLEKLKEQDPAIGLSHPKWLVDRWLARWGSDSTRQLLEWNNRPAPVFARVNLLKAIPEKLVEMWREENVEYDFFRAPYLPENLVFQLKSHPPLTRLPSFEQGLFYIQDPSTVLSVAELNPQPGDAVLDLCAAPGGKSTLAAQFMANQGRVYAHDLAPERLNTVRENCARLGATCVEIVPPAASSDASVRLAGVPDCDRVLVDAPCSNTGVMRRRVDLRWRISSDEVRRLRDTQVRLLSQALLHLKTGGTLIYSTCSLEPEENENLVRQFLAEHSGLRLEHERHLLPFKDGCDGAYVARIGV